MNVLLLLASTIGIAGLLLASVISLAMSLKLRAAVFAGLAAAWASLYGAGLLALSLTSREVVLPAGQTKRFCGFYLDCHIGVAVLGDSPAAAIGARRAAGSYHVLTLQFSSNAVRATLKPYDLRIELVGPDGTRYARDLGAEADLAGPASAGPLERDIPAGGAYTATVVFDVPAGVSARRLFVGEGFGIDRVLEAVLIGDEDSFLHQKTMLSLPNQKA